MPEDDQIKLSDVKDMDQKEIHILLIQGFNLLVRKTDRMKEKVDTYIQILDKKVGREEFKETKKELEFEIQKNREDIEKLQNNEENRKIQVRTGLGIGKYFWIVLLALMNLIQFFYAIAMANS